tara:strand:+ start:34311 stop:34913 length:603 start_codon:yes stop_codon:yes gene_type:complete
MILLNEGSKPILICSIHACKDWNELSTKEINEELNSKESYYSLINTGAKENCISDTEGKIYDILDSMLLEYARVGVISLHRRKQSCRFAKVDNNYFELGTIRNQSLDLVIKENLTKRLLEKKIVYDDNLQFTGGTECVNIHTRYNDPKFVRFETSGFDASKCKVQIAQIEINGSNREKDYPIHYEGVLTLARCMEDYFKI